MGEVYRAPCGVATDVKQGGPGTLNVVLRTTSPSASLRTAFEAIVREADPSVPIAPVAVTAAHGETLIRS